jgi:hypothetical protein
MALYYNILTNTLALHALGCCLSMCMRSLHETIVLPIEDGKKWYVAKNLFKGVWLFLLSPVATWALINILFYEQQDLWQLQILGVLYAAVDVAALLYEKRIKLSITTTVHHTVVMIFAQLIPFIDYNSPQHALWKGLVIYASWSTLTFIVNIYLGARFVLTKMGRSELRLQHLLAIVARDVYFYSLVANCICQIVNISYSPLNYTSAVYIFLILFIVNDDIVLYKFLSSEVFRIRKMFGK